MTFLDGGGQLELPGAGLAELIERGRAAGQRTAANTRKAYAADWRRFLEFAEQHGITSPLHATPDHLVGFAVWLSDHNRSPNSVQRAVAGVTWHIRDKLGQAPDHRPALRAAVAYRADATRAGWRENRADAYTLDELLQIKGQLDPRRPIDLRDWALIMLGVGIGARSSMLAVMDVGDIREDHSGDEMTVWAYIGVSKADQGARGHAAPIHRARVAELCPVTAVYTWLRWLHGQGVTSGPLWRALTGTAGDVLAPPQPRATTVEAREGRLSADQIGRRVRKRARAAGITRKIRGHSGRATFVTRSLRAGALPNHVAAIAGFAEGSPQVQRYARLEDAARHNPAAHWL
ncbi:tyrosine-type recombinase/integrase [Bailinhaonella thermotolerans]|uniref:tyrosine-type recombinase/integrase n=1 Tax=Bailinhaonella thermotolerans TaxID=1070861 RepID=UPI00192A1822|nr:tyrosine-type recombinase/integrase [Bailinhaonella thermotolerans]